MVGWTALHFACQKGHHKEARALFIKNANANLADALGCTPLHVVIHQGHGKIAVDLDLVVHGSAKNGARNHDGKTPLNFAS